MGNISYKFDISSYNKLCSRGPTKVLAESRKNACGGHLAFQNEAKNIPGQDFMVMNISYKSEKGSYTHIPNLKGLTNIFFKLLRPKGNLCGGGGGVTILNPKYPRLSSGDTIITCGNPYIFVQRETCPQIWEVNTLDHTMMH